MTQGRAKTCGQRRARRTLRMTKDSSSWTQQGRERAVAATRWGRSMQRLRSGRVRRCCSRRRRTMSGLVRRTEGTMLQRLRSQKLRPKRLKLKKLRPRRLRLWVQMQRRGRKKRLTPRSRTRAQLSWNQKPTLRPLESMPSMPILMQHMRRLRLAAPKWQPRILILGMRLRRLRARPKLGRKGRRARQLRARLILGRRNRCRRRRRVRRARAKLSLRKPRSKLWNSTRQA
mmetsp:Transcript_77759/g.202161  ORF Transcript_77759/g.202161 Transcript_77759/m.202161 type:complete len:230 (+) Transcript_77759:259-948(+)